MEGELRCLIAVFGRTRPNCAGFARFVATQGEKCANGEMTQRKRGLRMAVADRAGARAAAVAAALGMASSTLATPSIVIDVPTGQILEQDQATAVWYPASVTKLMTTYVALDAVRHNRITLDTPMVVSARARSMAPSKMGFKVGQEVTLRNALVMLMVKSANDVAVTIAEGVSGSVEAFAAEMNQASATIGMRESYWVNPNGLPDERQITSARDLALLGRALLTEFPEQANLFNVGAMKFGGKVIPNHNGMLGRYPGADGMKTGFTCPAGYNLVASATHGNQKLIAVVLGAPSPVARTAKTASLFDRAFQSPPTQGPASALASPGVGGAPDMREEVCHHRAKSTQDFMAEVEDLSISIAYDASGRAQTISSKELAKLPRPNFDPVPVYAGRAPGYVGPIARPREPGVAIGADAPATAYTVAPAAEETSPALAAAAHAKPARRVVAAHKSRAKTHAAAPTKAVAAKANAKTAAAKPSQKATATKAAHKEAAGKSKATPKHAEKLKAKAHGKAAALTAPTRVASATAQ
jgi:D-alanyl-D-alanine carboxypeptidase